MDGGRTDGPPFPEGRRLLSLSSFRSRETVRGDLPGVFVQTYYPESAADCTDKTVTQCKNVVA